MKNQEIKCKFCGKSTTEYIEDSPCKYCPDEVAQPKKYPHLYNWIKDGRYCKKEI